MRGRHDGHTFVSSCTLSFSMHQAHWHYHNSLTAPAVGPIDLASLLVALFSTRVLFPIDYSLHLVALPHQSDPSALIAPSGEPLSLPGMLGSFCFVFVALITVDGHRKGVYLIQTHLYNYLSNTRQDHQ